MSHTELLNQFERRIEELRSSLQKSAVTLPVAQKKCPYCAATFDSYADFSKHLKTCGEFKKTVLVTNPWQGDSPQGGLNAVPPVAERGPNAAQSVARTRKSRSGYGEPPANWQSKRRRTEKFVEVDGKILETFQKSSRS